MNNLFEFIETELHQIDRLKQLYAVETRAEAMRCAIRAALELADSIDRLQGLFEKQIPSFPRDIQG